MKDSFITIQALAVLLLIIFWRIENHWFLFGAIGLLIVSIASERLRLFIYKNWIRFARLLGKINTSVILGFVFFVILTPLSFFYRLFHRDQYDYFFADQESKYKNLNKTYNSSFFGKQW